MIARWRISVSSPERLQHQTDLSNHHQPEISFPCFWESKLKKGKWNYRGNIFFCWPAATYTKWKGLFVTRKSFLFAFTRRSKNFLISGVSFMYSFTCSPTMLCITGWLEPTAFCWNERNVSLFYERLAVTGVSINTYLYIPESY